MIRLARKRKATAVTATTEKTIERMTMMVFLDRTILKSYDFAVASDSVKIARILKEMSCGKKREALQG